MTTHAKLPRRSRAAIVAGVAGFLGLALWGGFGSGSPANLAAAERLLAARAAAAAAHLGAHGVRIAMDGQKAVLTGAVANPEIKARLLAAVKTSTPALLGAGGEISGGITRIVDRVEVLGASAPWRAVRRRFGALELSGPAPDARAEQALFSHAEGLFPGFARPAAQSVEPPATGPAARAWPLIAQVGVSALAHLTEAEFVLADGRAAIEGCAADSAALESARQAAASAPAPFVIAFAVESEENLGEYAPVLCLRPDARQCQSAFDALMGGGQARFAVNSAAMPDPAPKFLQRLGAFARRCARFSIRVEGHTDDQGAPAANQELSARRAGSVRDYLIAAGLRPDRLAVAALGGERPRCANDTPEGQACNRRVEIRVAAEP